MIQIVLLRGINLGPRNRIPMAELRALLTDTGYEDVRTYVQSGNVVLDSPVSTKQLAPDLEKLISEQFGFAVPVVVRTRDELAKVVATDPLKKYVTDPKRYLVSFLSDAPARDAIEQLEIAATKGERVELHGRELYAWLPEGAARSKLWSGLASDRLGVTATARNWNTVTTLLQMADA